MNILFIILASIVTWLVIGKILSHLLAHRVAALCMRHNREYRYSDNGRTFHEWNDCPGKTCTNPQWEHTLSRTSFEGWMIGLGLMWPIFAPVVIGSHTSRALADKYDPGTHKALQARISYLEKQELEMQKRATWETELDKNIKYHPGSIR